MVAERYVDFFECLHLLSLLRTDRMLNTGRISIHVRRAKDHYFVIQTNANPWHRISNFIRKGMLDIAQLEMRLLEQFYDVFLLAIHFPHKRQKVLRKDAYAEKGGNSKLLGNINSIKYNIIW